MTLKTGRLWVSVTLMLLTLCVFRAEAAKTERGTRDRKEIRGDRYFIKGDYDRAMKMYENANATLERNDIRKYALELKMARLYTGLQQPKKAIEYYEAVYGAADTMLTVNDICFFIDALRQNGQSQEAEVIVRNIAFRTKHGRNQRYINTLYALANQQHYYAKGNDPCTVEMFEKSGSKPEYWLGKLDGKLFYAVSHSQFQDPLKIFYHRTQYFSLNGKEMTPFQSIPRELQSGPLTFSDNGRMMVATGISYRNRGSIGNIGDDRGMYVTQLYYSRINPANGRWSRSAPLFDYQEGYSYAHPTFFNGGRSLIFSSDRPGGFGGMDLYIANWNETALKWDDPVNLGGMVNTEGDEIYPLIMDGVLYFSSNGHEGFGGYDIYRATFDRNIVLPGTFYHYPYPVNTTFNDFGMFLNGDTGYLISDRGGASGKEDIYTFDNVALSLGRDDLNNISQEYSAMRGNLNLVTGLKNSNKQQFNKPLDTASTPENGEVLLSVYFAFNSSTLDNESLAALNDLLSEPSVKNMHRLSIVGYADELGTLKYNQRLSEERAQSVARYLKRGKIVPELTTEGRGQIALSDAEYQAAVKEFSLVHQINIPGELKNYAPSLSMNDKIRINRGARRVDIICQQQ